MAKLTKRMRVIREKVDATKQYDINEAIALLKELATAKFVESVDVAVNLGGEGFEPSKSVTADLQSAPFGRSGTPPDLMVPTTGIELVTY